MKPRVKRWFGEERALDDQMRGPDQLLMVAQGRSILDLACAEGLISLELVRAGARSVTGIEVVPSRVDDAVKNFCGKGIDAVFIQADLEDFATKPDARLERSYDIVLALSIAHKLKDPAAFLRAAAERCGEYMAIRLPNPTINDIRSNHRKVDVPLLMAAAGFQAWREGRHHLNEWTGIYRRA